MKNYKAEFTIAGENQVITRFFKNVTNTTALYNFIVNNYGHLDYIKMEKI